jgi:hypothetical protein
MARNEASTMIQYATRFVKEKDNPAIQAMQTHLKTILLASLVLLSAKSYAQDTLTLTLTSTVRVYYQAMLPEGSDDFSSGFDAYLGWHRRALFVAEGDSIFPAVLTSPYVKGLYFDESIPLEMVNQGGFYDPLGDNIENPTNIPVSKLEEVPTRRFWRKRNLDQPLSTFYLRIQCRVVRLGSFKTKILNPKAVGRKNAWLIQEMEVYSILEVLEAEFIDQ